MNREEIGPIWQSVPSMACSIHPTTGWRSTLPAGGMIGCYATFCIGESRSLRQMTDSDASSVESDPCCLAAPAGQIMETSWSCLDVRGSLRICVLDGRLGDGTLFYLRLADEHARHREAAREPEETVIARQEAGAV